MTLPRASRKAAPVPFPGRQALHVIGEHALQECLAIAPGHRHLAQHGAVDDTRPLAHRAVLRGGVSVVQRDLPAVDLAKARAALAMHVVEEELVGHGALYNAARGPRPSSRPRRAPALSPAPARLVSAPSARAAVAPHRRSLSHPGLRDHAAADPGGPGHPEVPRVPRAIPDPREPGRGGDRRGQAHLVPARLQRAAPESSGHRPRDARPL